VLSFLRPYNRIKLGFKFTYNVKINSLSSGIYSTELSPTLSSKHVNNLELGQNGDIREEAQSKAAWSNCPSSPIDDFVYIMQGCGDTKSLAQGKSVHAHMFIYGFEHEDILMSKLVTMYGRCGSMWKHE